MAQSGKMAGNRSYLSGIGRHAVGLIVIIGMSASLYSSPATAEDAGGAPAARSKGPYKYTNRLADSNDPYLLLHAHNPVDWYPWGSEAFAKARQENKPIFISIGYSTCYWCHVAERTIYSNPDIAKLMNEWFVNVKVDSEQRPDVDRIYMLARQILTSHGGWPNNLFLAPDLKPFYAGSYFPPKDDPRAGPGFPAVLTAIHQLWSSDQAKAIGVASKVMEAMRSIQTELTRSTTAPIEPGAWLAKARDTLLPQFDPFDAGLADRRSGTKFPNEPRLALLLADYDINHTPKALSVVSSTLDAMVFGGIHDQLGGGFHRYSTEPTWSIPHFEKMLYDNAQLLRLYAEAFRLTNNPLYRQIALETGQYLGHDMMSPEGGGFYTARDAQLNGVEGEGYLWTRGEIVSLLGDKEAARFLAVYSLTPVPRPDVPDIVHPRDVNGEPPAVLRVRVPTDQSVKAAGFKDVPQMLADFASDRAKLLAAREKRQQPARDEKIVISLNGLAIEALAESGAILHEPQFATWARQAAERIWTLAYDTRTAELKHEMFRGRVQTEGFLQDYALLGAAFLSLADVTGDKTWQDRAAMLGNRILDRFARADGSFSTSPHEKDLLIPMADEGDMETPSGTSAAIDLLLRLHKRSGDARYLDAATRAITRLSGQFQDRPEGWAAAVGTLNRQALAAASEAAVPADASAAKGETSGFHIPVTADHVQVKAVGKSSADAEEIDVILKIDEKYHVNANPASLDFLIPTSVEFDGVKPSKLEYPKPIRFKAEFAPEGLDVYEGVVTVVARFPKGSLQQAGTVHATITAQACTNQICLPPSTLPVSVAGADR